MLREGWRRKKEAAWNFEILFIQNVQRQKNETWPTCLSNQIKRLVKFQLPSSTQFGFRAFQSFRRPCFCISTLFMQKSTVLTNYALCIFLGDKRNGKLWKIQKYYVKRFFLNAQLDFLGPFYFQFFIAFEKFTSHSFFQLYIFLHISPLPQPIETKKWHLTIFSV